MSRTVAIVLALTLIVPLLAFFAVVLATGVNPGLISGFITFIVLATFVVAAVFEIKRLVDL